MQRTLIFVTGSLALLASLPAALALPIKSDRLPSYPRPSGSYAEAVERIARLQAQDTDAVNPVCRTRFLTHGQPAERAVVFLHGYTNCPQQFALLGRRFYKLGYNVLIPRLPHNGLADRLNTEHAQLTGAKLVSFADEVVDIARGLGEHITVVGLSASGVLAAWVAQYRSDVDRAVILSPCFALPNTRLPSSLASPAMILSLKLPNKFIWWDKTLKCEAPAPRHTYPRFSTHALGEVLQLGVSVQSEARETKPAARSILVVTTAGDKSVDNRITHDLIDVWREQGAEAVRMHEFAADLSLPHDFIDPDQVDQNTSLVYPILIDLITSG